MENQLTDPKKFVDLLATFKLGLEHGLVEKSEVVRWADGIVEKEAEPDIFFIELALCETKKSNDVIEILNQFLEETPSVVSSRAALGLIYRHFENGKISLKQAVNTLYRLYWKTDLSDYELNFLYSFDENYELAVDGRVGDVREIEAALIQFLEIYKNFRLDNFEDWNSINSTIYERVRQLDELPVAQPSAPKIVKKPWWRFW